MSYIQTDSLCIEYRSSIGALIYSIGGRVASDEVKANMCNDHYATVGVKYNGTIPTCHPIALIKVLETVNFSATCVIKTAKILSGQLTLFAQLLSVGGVHMNGSKHYTCTHEKCRCLELYRYIKDTSSMQMNGACH